MKVRFDNSQPDFGVKSVLDNLLSYYFSDLPRGKYLEISIGLTNDPDKIYLVGVMELPWFSLFPEVYVMKGNLPEGIVDEENLESILKGTFGHELAHIAKGHYNPIRTFFDQLAHIHRFGKKLDNAVNEAKEKAADKETIKRGLGQDLYHAKLYSDSIGTPYNGYTSSETKSLLSKSVH